MTEVDKTSSSIRPSIHYPRSRASDLGVRGGNDERLIAQDEVDCGEANPAEEVEGTFDVEDSQPLKTLTTPELPSREIIEAHRIDHWPRDRGATNAMKAIAESGHMAVRNTRLL